MPSAGPIELLIIAVILAIFVVPVVVVVWALNRRSTAVSPLNDPALDVLRARFAAGEIDEIDFLRLRSVLQGD